MDAAESRRHEIELAGLFRSIRFGALLVLLLCVSSLLPRPALATWPHDPWVNVPVCTMLDTQIDALAVSDGAGGCECWRAARTPRASTRPGGMAAMMRGTSPRAGSTS